MSVGIALTACGGDDSGKKNTPPAVGDLTFSIAENVPTGTVVETVEATDEEKDALSFAITEGNTNEAFAINADLGQLVTAKLLDFEKIPRYVLLVTVSDGQMSVTANITIDLEDVNEAPTIAPDQSFSVVEDAANGIAVGTVQAADPEKDNLTFSISSGNTGNAFVIGESTGAITTAGALDFENNPNYTLTVSVSDGNLSATADITVSVTNVNDNAPTIVDQTFSVPEDAQNGTTVGTVQASDVETNNLTFTITSGNTGNVFVINKSLGAITTAATLDFETTPNYTLAVKVSDGKLSGTANITINVEDINESEPEPDDSDMQPAMPAADFTVSSTNTTINIDGLANVYTIALEISLTNWSVTSSDDGIIPDNYIQKMGDMRFAFPVSLYSSSPGGTSRSIMLTVSGTGGGNNLVLTVTQAKSTTDIGLIHGTDYYVIQDKGFSVIAFQRPSTAYSDEASVSLDMLTVDGNMHFFTVSVSPSESIHLRNSNPRVNNEIFVHYTPPSGSNLTYGNNYSHKYYRILKKSKYRHDSAAAKRQVKAKRRIFTYMEFQSTIHENAKAHYRTIFCLNYHLELNGSY
ncbi:MAG: cadherin repeat domain-containing protein [Ekhidna sp.]|nr:cadherin repeat domain-containing protein [Ekhidna sp.]